MAEPKFDVLGIGNAIVDVIATAEEDFLVREGLIKGSMRLIETDEAERLYGAMGQAVQTSGGCAGNTAAGVASFGGRAAFIGKVADDGLGRVYRHDMHALGIDFETKPLIGGEPTARSMILITPDGERTMNTYLGAAQLLSPDDIDEAAVGAARITYLEGYLWDRPQAKAAFRKAAKVAHAAGRKVSLTLSDSFCVDRFRDEFLGLIRDGSVDVLFANLAELHALYQTADLDTAISALRADARIAAVTAGADGAFVISRENVEVVPAYPVERIVDTTGAGDLFAAGFLYGLAHGTPLATAAKLGHLAAGEVIGHIGPRPAVSLKGLAQQAGLHIE
ncbi:MAG TPA: adenosine kinase [Bauldia sp.]|nr:adenosine kinase [Bauldia sp.]